MDKCFRSTMVAVALLATIASVAITGCGQTPPASKPGEGPAAASPSAAPAAKSAAGAWDILVGEARKEGQLVVASGMLANARDATTAAFKKKYGINVEWIVGRPPELEAKIKAERNAGLSTVDIGIPGTPSIANVFKPMGMTLPIEPLLLLPEVTDATKWRGGRLPFFDSEKHGFQVVSVAGVYYIINTETVRKDEITRVVDLLDPKWKGKIIISDPTVPGNASDWFAFTVVEVLGRDKGVKFMQDLLKQEPVVTRDERQLTEWVARGKYLVGIAPSQAVVAEFIKMGARVAYADMKEPRLLTPGWGIMCVFNKAPHPNAGQLFVNWLLSKEGSSVFAPALGYPSNRIDVPTDAFLPDLVPAKEDVDVYTKYDFIAIKSEMMTRAAEVFRPAMGK